MESKGKAESLSLIHIYTFVIDRMEEEALDQHINRNLKRNIKEASAGLAIQRQVDAKTFYEMCSNTYKRQKMDMPYSFTLFSNVDAAVLSRGNGIKLGACDLRGKLVACLLYTSLLPPLPPFS